VRAKTHTQSAVLAFVERFCTGNGCSPTLREISKQFGWGGTRATERHLLALEKKGWISRAPGRARGIRVNGGG